MPASLSPYEFQEADLRTLEANGWSGFVVAEVGAGKTLIGIEAARRSPATRILIIAVKTTLDEWRNGILRQDPTADVRVIDGTPEGKEAMERLEWGYDGYYIVTHQKFTLTDWSLTEPHMTIVDEAHLVGNHTGKGSKVLRKLKTRRRIVMSGTMVRNKFQNFYALAQFVYPDENGSEEIADISPNRWIRTWCEWEEDHFSPNGMKVVGEKNPGAFAEALPCYIQHFKREQCCEFHPHGFLEGLDAPKTIEVHVDLTREQKRLIRQMEADYVAWLEDQARERQIHVVKLPVTARTRLRQMTLGVPSIIPGIELRDQDGELIYDDEGNIAISKDEVYFEEDAESPKIDVIIDILLGADQDQILGPNAEHEQALILTSSQKFMKPAIAQMQAAGIQAVEWSGKVNKNARADIKSKFIAGDSSVRVIVAVVSSIGTGTDGLQFATNNLIFAEKSDDMTQNVQAEGRLDRRGQTRQVKSIEIIARESMDEQIISDQLQRRLALSKSLRRQQRKAMQAA